MSAATLDRRQLAAMNAGRKRADKQRARDALARVNAYRRWLNAGSPMAKIPEIPTPGDYRMAERSPSRLVALRVREGRA